MAPDPLGDERGFLRAVALDRRVPGDLDAVVLYLFKFQKREARAHARAHGHRRSEAHAVKAAVDAHLAVAEREGGFREVREQRQREKAVRDGAAEGRALGARRVDVDPLEVLDRAGEGIDALLRDLDPRRDADLLPDAGLELADGGHFCWPNPWRSRSRTRVDSS